MKLRYCPHCGYDGSRMGGIASIVIRKTMPKDFRNESCCRCGHYPMKLDGAVRKMEKGWAETAHRIGRQLLFDHQARCDLYRHQKPCKHCDRFQEAL